ncbi:MAG: NAD(P)-binding domain-containing protein [Phycisphaerales bacterium]|nr:NAD(P)-binding domain-containing protein [Phycisphaerae bacterium]NNF43272.1 NAD(P)-binding domain-containing protein [Phycisphaerales bacterium]NNM24617.1 NAD(P)-binding domain-containing protein [Phycisphaerales bacterium]
MLGFVGRYMNWLHTRWPAGTVERLPLVREGGATNVPGLFIVGDLTGIPLLKFSSDSGARAIQAILADKSFQERDTSDPDVLDVVIVGAGVSGVAAMAEARSAGLAAEIIEASEPLSTIVNFPKGKPIYTYPTEMVPAGELQFSARAAVKEGLVSELCDFMEERGITPRQVRVERVRRTGGLMEVILAGGEVLRTHRVVVGIGRSGNFRKLGVPGEELDKVSNRLHDPKEFKSKHVLVVGGGDSALEAAIAIAKCGGFVTLSYRKKEFARPKPDNVEAIRQLADDPFADVAVEEPSSERITTSSGKYLGKHRRAGSIRLMMASNVTEIRADEVDVRNDRGHVETLPNDAVFPAIGREAPLDFFRRSGVHIRGEWRPMTYLTFGLFFLFCLFLYHWKSDFGIPVKAWFKDRHWFPFNLQAAGDPATIVGTLWQSMQTPSFYYTLAYSTCIVLFGITRIRRRRTPYVTVQTSTLAAIQVFPLFLLPYFVLPWIGHNGGFDDGVGKAFADALFPVSEWDVHGREYWRSVGFILAWPLMIWNVFTHQPLMAWLVIGFVQTFVIIPLIVWRWGKGAYCGWICSCGALAETMGDAHRHKMPHGPRWNRLNMLGQVFLVFALLLLVARVIGWAAPDGSTVDRWADTIFMAGLYGQDTGYRDRPFPLTFLNYAWFVDLLWAGVFGVAFYFWFSGRVWCRFACPLAALMHIYARFTRFRIIPEKKKCISCNVCTSVCHQGIDIMNFANKGLPMADPQCVRCSACVQSCPTGVLRFGRVDREDQVLGYDRLAASPVLMREAELTVDGRRRGQ